MPKRDFTELFQALGKPLEQDIVSFRDLYTSIEALRPTRILEVGYRFGGTSRMWQNLVPETGLVVAVDIAPAPVAEQVNLDPSVPFRLIVGDSKDPSIVAEVSALGPFDALFIDGDHSYEGVRADYENYAPLVRSGGVISFHDWGHEPILRFWNEINVPGKRVIQGALTIGMFVKQ